MPFDALYGSSNALSISPTSIFHQIPPFRFDIPVDAIAFATDEEINYLSEVLGSAAGLGTDTDEATLLAVEAEDRRVARAQCEAIPAAFVKAEGERYSVT